jgi:hypothetical protein
LLKYTTPVEGVAAVAPVVAVKPPQLSRQELTFLGYVQRQRLHRIVILTDIYDAFWSCSVFKVVLIIEENL